MGAQNIVVEVDGKVQDLATFLVAKWLFHLLGQEATRWLALPFGLWCVVFALAGATDPLRGRLEGHFNASNAIGWFIGLACATIFLF